MAFNLCLADEVGVSACLLCTSMLARGWCKLIPAQAYPSPSSCKKFKIINFYETHKHSANTGTYFHCLFRSNMELEREVWQGRVPCCFCLDANDAVTLTPPQPLYVRPLLFFILELHIVCYLIAYGSTAWLPPFDHQ